MRTRLSIDFAPIPPRSVYAAYGLLIGASVLGLFLLIDVASVWMTPAPIDEADNQAVAATEPKHDADLYAQIAAAKRVLGELAVPWGPLLDAIETAREESLVLSNITADAAQRMWRLQGRAHDLETITRFTAALRAQPPTASAQLLRHSTDTGAAGPAITFEISASWPSR